MRSVTPLPSIGDVIVGRDVAGRELRISGHPDADRLVLSIWQSSQCLATVRLARADVPDVTRALVAGLITTPSTKSAPELGAANRFDGPGASVHELPRSRPQDNDRPIRGSVSASVRKRLGELGRRLSRFDERN
jgi:hypothetical protein